MAFASLRFVRRSIFFVLFLPFIEVVDAQAKLSDQSQLDSQPSPQVAYELAIRPLEITRRSPQNWSETELAALKVARDSAKVACLARSPDSLAGEDLLALARLCAFAQQWQPVHRAASNYIAATSASTLRGNPRTATGLSMAFDYRVQASLSLKDVDDAIVACQTMLKTVPYDTFSSEATNSALDTIRFIDMDRAMALLAQRQPILLAQIKAHGSESPAATSATNAPNGESSLPLRALYTDAIAYPLLQQFANQSKEAEDSYAQLESALPGAIPPDDAIYIAERRRQYLLVGKHLPILHATGSLLHPGAAPPDNLNTWFGNGAVFLLFPDWCNQCIVMGFDSLAKSRDLVTAHDVRLVTLLAQANAPQKRAEGPVKDVPLSAEAAKAALSKSQQLHTDQQLAMKSSPDALLEGTPTVVVPNEALDTFAAVDFPLLVATDHGGTIRWIQRESDNALDPGGDIDQIIEHILAMWPPN